MKKRYDINLIIKQKPDPQQALIYFLLNYFKHILVITQIIIIAVFMYRLKLDIEISDLTDTYYSNREFVEVAKPMLKDLEERSWLSNRIGQELNKEAIINQMIEYLIQIFPRDFVLTSIRVDHDKMIIEGNSIDYLTIMRFYNRLRKDKKFEDVKLGNIVKTEFFFRFQFSLGKFRLEE